MGLVQPIVALWYVRIASSFLRSLYHLSPVGHFATLTTTLEQSTDHTKVTWSLTGVPLGMEDEINRNINGY